MPVQCRICQAEFSKLITSTHLQKHNMKTKEYIEIYGRESLCSNEYRKERSERNLGDKNPNYGNKMSDISKQSISIKNKGKDAWNKGLIFENTDIQQQAVALREERYKSGELIRYVPIHTEETKKKISNAVKIYANANPAEISNRAQKAIQTKRDTGYFEKKRNIALAEFSQRCNDNNFTVNSIKGFIATVECNVCNTVHARSVRSITHDSMCRMCSNVSTSSYEVELYSILSELLPNEEILYSDRSVLSPLELDIYIPSRNFAIEIDGLYWHSEEKGKGKFYHSYKTYKCREKGIQLIHIFEDEWIEKKDICISRIKHKLNLDISKVYARRCDIRIIENTNAHEFLQRYHIHGRGKSTYNIGLFYNNELISVMTFVDLSVSKEDGIVDKAGHFELSLIGLHPQFK